MWVYYYTGPTLGNLGDYREYGTCFQPLWARHEGRPVAWGTPSADDEVIL